MTNHKLETVQTSSKLVSPQYSDFYRDLLFYGFVTGAVLAGGGLAYVGANCFSAYLVKVGTTLLNPVSMLLTPMGYLWKPLLHFFKQEELSLVIFKQNDTLVYIYYVNEKIVNMVIKCNNQQFPLQDVVQYLPKAAELTTFVVDPALRLF